MIINGILVFITVGLLLAEKFLVASGERKLVINKDMIFEIKPGKSVLSYLSEKKIFIPSGCGGKATCGYCKIKVLSGGAALLPTEEGFINRDERLSGIRLACQVKVREDIEIYIPEHLLGAQEFNATVIKKEVLTHDIKRIVLRLEDPQKIEFKPGQYVQIKVPDTDEFRAYSVASSPAGNDSIELIIRFVPGGVCSTYIHEDLEVGDKIVFTGPLGDFYLREDSHRDIVAIGGGCGMAPLKSILYYLKEKGLNRKFAYFFGARQKRDLFFTEELKKVEGEFSNFKYIPALSEPKPSDNWDGETGFISQVVERYVESGENSEAYLCGPPPMIDAAIKVLTQKGVKEIYIYYDKF